MELEPLFMTSRWDILKILSQKGKSPLEISQELNATISYVSQQLKLLEAAGLVKKEKISTREKGKPRTVFSLSKDCSYLISIANKFTEKKLLSLTDYHKLILKIWFLDDPSLHYYIEKFYWKIEENLSEIEGIFIDSLRKGICIIIVSKNPKKLKERLAHPIKKFESEVKDFSCLIHSIEDFERKIEHEGVHALYDPNGILKNQKEVKGGE
jgi:DNA-binding Lrp family transcriptional regulator